MVRDHGIRFASFGAEWLGLLSQQDVRDVIDLFYDGPYSFFVIVGIDNSPGRRGSCMSIGNTHTITLSLSTIEKHLDEKINMGGNKVHNNVREAIFSVLAHEIQHANQSQRHKADNKFWRGNYLARPCEVDARSFADSQVDTISSVIGDNISIGAGKVNDGLEEIIEVLSMSDDVKTEDIVQELKSYGLYNTINVGHVLHSLAEKKHEVP